MYMPQYKMLGVYQLVLIRRSHVCFVQAWNYKLHLLNLLYMCEYWMLQEIQKPFCHSIIMFTSKSLIWKVISDWSGVELGDACLIFYDLLHVPWNIMGHLPIQCLFLSFSSSGESRLIRREPTTSTSICSVQICLPPCLHTAATEDSSVCLFCRGQCPLVDRNVYQHHLNCILQEKVLNDTLFIVKYSNIIKKDITCV